MSSTSRTFALLGDPVVHSLSPLMHAAAFDALGVHAAYHTVRCGVAELPALLPAFARTGGGNITHPLKQVVMPALDEARGAAKLLGTCNTFWAEDDRVIGDNTDVAGITAATEELGIAAGPWLVLGTGGSARAAALAAAQRGAPLSVRSRDPARAAAFSRWASVVLGAAVATVQECVLIVNTTPLGLRDSDALPPLLAAAPRAAAALDLNYRHGETAWVRAARDAGLRAADGRGVLVAQGAASLGHWFPGVAAPIDVMRRAVDAALA